MFCPTDEMTSNFNTKPLQGSKFVQFRNQLQGVSIDEYDSYQHYYKKIMVGYKLFDEHENDLFPEAWRACRSVLEIKGIKEYPYRSSKGYTIPVTKMKEESLNQYMYLQLI